MSIKSFLFTLLIMVGLPLSFFAQRFDTAVINIKQGEIFEIKLDFSPGAGYRWEIDTVNLSNVKVLNFKRDVPISSKPKGGIFQDVLTLKGLSKGTTYLRCEYKYLRDTAQEKIYMINCK